MHSSVIEVKGDILEGVSIFYDYNLAAIKAAFEDYEPKSDLTGMRERF